MELSSCKEREGGFWRILQIMKPQEFSIRVGFADFWRIRQMINPQEFSIRFAWFPANAGKLIL